jgi:hypothetical protein
VTGPISGKILDEICRINIYCLKNHLKITSIPAEKYISALIEEY